MDSFFQSTLWVAISAIISILGLVGTILGIYQYLKNNKELQEYKYLFKVAEQHVDLEDKKSQIDNYESQIAHMKKALNEQIPTEAKKIALKGILDNELQVLSTTYTKVKSLQAELEVLTPENDVGTEKLMKNVNKIIEPAYSRKRIDNLLSTVFYLVSIFSSFLSMVLPYTIYQMIIVIILLFQLIVAIRTIINMVKLNYTRKERNRLKKKLLLISTIIFLFLSLFSIILIIFCEISPRYYIDEDVCLILATFFFILHLFTGCVFFIKNSIPKMIVFLSLSLIYLVSTVASIILYLPLLFIVSTISGILNIIFLFICLARDK